MTSQGYAVLGLIIVAAAWLPLVFRGLPVPLTILALGAGFVAASMQFPVLFPGEISWMVELARLALILAIMTAGLRIDRPFDFRGWRSAGLLLAVGLPVSVGVTALLGSAILGLPIALAVLLGAILAPTDPVLADSVQVGPPGTGEEGELRFALTAEAGCNDGLALSFVTLGLYLASPTATGWFGHWVMVDLIWHTVAGGAVGLAIGLILTLANRLLPEHMRLSRSESGMVSIGVTFAAYGLAELVAGNGFIAVFVAAVALRASGRATGYMRRIHDFAGEVERVVTLLVLAEFGAALASGVLQHIGWPQVLFVTLMFVLVRPLSVFVTAPFSPLSRQETVGASYLGVRGIASIYYVILVARTLTGDDRNQLLSIVALVVLVSVLLYGATGTWAIRTFGPAPPSRDADRSADPANPGTERPAG